MRSSDDKQRFDPYDPRKGATRRDAPEDKRSLPGGGEDKDVNGTADREPDDAEDGDTAR
jgi:hypothetical protein